MDTTLAIINKRTKPALREAVSSIADETFDRASKARRYLENSNEGIAYILASDSLVDTSGVGFLIQLAASGLAKPETKLYVVGEEPPLDSRENALKRGISGWLSTPEAISQFSSVSLKANTQDSANEPIETLPDELTVIEQNFRPSTQRPSPFASYHADIKPETSDDEAIDEREPSEVRTGNEDTISNASPVDPHQAQQNNHDNDSLTDWHSWQSTVEALNSAAADEQQETLESDEENLNTQLPLLLAEIEQLKIKQAQTSLPAQSSEAPNQADFIAEVKNEIKQELREEIKAELQQTVLAELRTELEPALKQSLRAEIMQDLRQELKQELLQATKTEFIESMKDEIAESVEESVLEQGTVMLMASKDLNKQQLNKLSDEINEKLDVLRQQLNALKPTY